MARSIRDILDSRAGKAVLSAIALTAIIIAILMVHNAVAPSYAQKIANDRVYMDVTTNQTFVYTLVPGKPAYPVHSPYSGKDTAYPTEKCYWTADGGTMDQPTYVVLNDYLGKSGPTFCPVCGRLVVGHNPPPGGRPPPTKAEYEAQGN